MNINSFLCLIKGIKKYPDKFVKFQKKYWGKLHEKFIGINI